MRTNLSRRTVQVPLAIGVLVVLVALTIASLTAVTEGDLEKAPTPAPPGISSVDEPVGVTR